METSSDKGASEFMVKDGDVVAWQYTCQLGADIGDTDWNKGSSNTGNSNKDGKEECESESKSDSNTKQPVTVSVSVSLP